MLQSTWCLRYAQKRSLGCLSRSSGEKTETSEKESEGEGRKELHNEELHISILVLSLYDDQSNR